MLMSFPKNGPGRDKLTEGVDDGVSVYEELPQINIR